MTDIIFDLASHHALVGWEEREEEELHAIMSSTPWKPASIKISHQPNFTFYSQFAEITRWLLNSCPVSTFRKQLSRAVGGWVGGKRWGFGVSLIPTSHVQISIERSHFLACHRHVALWSAQLSLYVGFHFWGRWCKYHPLNELKYFGLLSGLGEGGFFFLAATEDKGSKVIRTAAAVKKGDYNTGWFPA